MKTTLTFLLFFILSIAKSQTNITLTPSQAKFYNSAATGITGDFRTLGLGNTSHSLTSFTEGTGKAGFFGIDNNTSSADALSTQTYGSGRAFTASSIGGAAGYFTSQSGPSIITAVGKVGIGVPSPDQLLDVNGRARIRHNGSSAGIWMSNALNGLAGGDGAFFGINCSVAGTETAGIFIGNAWGMEIDRSWNLKVRGAITSSVGLITTCSDRRFKKDFTKIESPLKKISQLDGLHYYWRTEEFLDRGFSKDRQIGFIAQEIEKIFPEMVFTDEKGFKSVDYARLTPVLVEAMKEQQKQIEDLKNKNQKLESRFDKIEAMLQK
jgi:Chaperone of endosialidase